MSRRYRRPAFANNPVGKLVLAIRTELGLSRPAAGITATIEKSKISKQPSDEVCARLGLLPKEPMEMVLGLALHHELVARAVERVRGGWEATHRPPLPAIPDAKEEQLELFPIVEQPS